MREVARFAHENQSQGRLLKTLAEELKLPLMQIARSAELARLSGDASEMQRTEALSETVLRLLDSYVLSAQTMIGQQRLELSPVSLKATLYDTAQYLYKLAKLYDCEVELNVSGKCGLVMAHPEALQAAFTSLGYSFINSGGDKKDIPTRIVLSANRSNKGVITGMHTSNQKLDSNILQQAKELYGVAKQPMANFTYASGAGIMIANSLFDAMNSSLRVLKSKNSPGLVATLLPSQQLALL